MLNFNSQLPNQQNLYSSKMQSRHFSAELNFISVPCLNCQEIILYENIDRHSQKCFAVTPQVLQLDSQMSGTQEIDFKISKIKESLQRLMESKQNYKFQKEKINLLARAIEIIHLFQTMNIKDQLLEELKSIKDRFSDKLSISLQLDRLIQLYEQKSVTINDNKENKQRQKEELKNLIKEKKEQFDKMKHLSQQYRVETEQSMQLFNNLLKIEIPRCYTEESEPAAGDITIGRFGQSSNNFRSEVLTQTSMRQNESEDDFINSNDGQLMQTIFYSKCLNQKLKLPINHPSQKIPISILFKEMIGKRIPQNKWDLFIYECLQTPERYLDFNKINGSCKNNLKQKFENVDFRKMLQKKI